MTLMSFFRVAKEHAQVVKFTTRWVEGIRALLRAWELGKKAGDDARAQLQQQLAEQKHAGNVTDLTWKVGIVNAHSANVAHSAKQRQERMDEEEAEADKAAEEEGTQENPSASHVCRTCAFLTLITLLFDINV